MTSANLTFSACRFAFSSLPKTAAFEEPQETAVVAEFGKRESTVVFNLHLSFISLISPCVGVS